MGTGRDRSPGCQVHITTLVLCTVQKSFNTLKNKREPHFTVKLSCSGVLLIQRFNTNVSNLVVIYNQSGNIVGEARGRKRLNGHGFPQKYKLLSESGLS